MAKQIPAILILHGPTALMVMHSDSLDAAKAAVLHHEKTGAALNCAAADESDSFEKALPPPLTSSVAPDNVRNRDSQR
jgi:hypothetical protein